jgi:thymidylate synthase (FAD)
MITIEPAFKILDHNNIEWIIERSARTCYKSEGKMGDAPNMEFIHKLRRNNHASVLEHGVVTVLVITDRGVSHELVRHRLAAYSQESTRYCNYGSDRFGDMVSFIVPYYYTEPERYCEYVIWYKAMQEAEKTYFQLLEQGSKPEEARAVLPNSLKTEIVITANCREWKHIFSLRCSPKAHPQMRQIMSKVQSKFKELWPAIFESYPE